MSKAGHHPEFYRLPAPPGRSRESTIVLKRDGRFYHDGAIVEHPGLERAMHAWIGRHPDDGRFILDNGYDWTYFTVEDAPYFVVAVRDDAESPVLVLSDGHEEAWIDQPAILEGDSALYVDVKAGQSGGPYRARFSRHAQTALAPWIHEVNGGFELKTKNRSIRIRHL